MWTQRKCALKVITHAKAKPHSSWKMCWLLTNVHHSQNAMIPEPTVCRNYFLHSFEWTFYNLLQLYFSDARLYHVKRLMCTGLVKESLSSQQRRKDIAHLEWLVTKIMSFLARRKLNKILIFIVVLVTIYLVFSDALQMKTEALSLLTAGPEPCLHTVLW